MSIAEMLNATNQYADLASTKQLIGSEAPQTVSGVLGEFINVLQESFQGNFVGRERFPCGNLFGMTESDENCSLNINSIPKDPQKP